MSQLATSHGSSAEVKDLAAGIAAAQGPEIDTMTTWLKNWGKDVTGHRRRRLADHHRSDQGTTGTTRPHPRRLRRAWRGPDSIHFFESTGLDYVSCSPFRIPVARLEAARAVLLATRSTS